MSDPTLTTYADRLIEARTAISRYFEAAAAVARRGLPEYDVIDLAEASLLAETKLAARTAMDQPTRRSS